MLIVSWFSIYFSIGLVIGGWFMLSTDEYLAGEREELLNPFYEVMGEVATKLFMVLLIGFVWLPICFLCIVSREFENS